MIFRRHIHVFIYYSHRMVDAQTFAVASSINYLLLASGKRYWIVSPYIQNVIRAQFYCRWTEQCYRGTQFTRSLQANRSFRLSLDILTISLLWWISLEQSFKPFKNHLPLISVWLLPSPPPPPPSITSATWDPPKKEHNCRHFIVSLLNMPFLDLENWIWCFFLLMLNQVMPICVNSAALLKHAWCMDVCCVCVSCAL